MTSLPLRGISPRQGENDNEESYGQEKSDRKIEKEAEIFDENRAQVFPLREKTRLYAGFQSVPDLFPRARKPRGYPRHH